ncbi:MAG: response regulator [Candidatus Omnitrophica bacterium]|nr:response regulator [Candidatus Omnitrophota bacterium]
MNGNGYDNRGLVSAKILLVDDDDIFRSEFAEFLEEGYHVVEASSGEEALSLLQKPNEIDLVILDVRMSGMDGIEVLERIKQLKPEIRVVISTGFGSKDMAVDALRSRADDYIEKPIVFKTALEIIARHVGHKEKIKYGEGIDGKIDRVKDYIRRNCDKKITLKDAADIVCLCPKYLSRIFQERTKTGFNEFALSLKMEKARVYLEKTTFTVEQTAEKLGYLNSESFIRLFKKIDGVTPAEYRRKRDRKGLRAVFKKSRKGRNR